MRRGLTCPRLVQPPHWCQPNWARLALAGQRAACCRHGAGRARAFAHRLPFSSAREALRGPGHSKAACACPGTSRLGLVGGLSGSGYHGGVDLAGGPVVPAMQGPLPGRAAAGRAGAARPLALRPRPGEPRLPLSTGRPGHKPIRDHEEHGVISTSIPNTKWRTMPCTRPSRTETLRQPM
jgi:hypothetical protein